MAGNEAPMYRCKMGNYSDAKQDQPAPIGVSERPNGAAGGALEACDRKGLRGAMTWEGHWLAWVRRPVWGALMYVGEMSHHSSEGPLHGRQIGSKFPIPNVY
jgi:hypothetical protein